MPRVNNELTAVAGRAIDKAIDIQSAIAEAAELREVIQSSAKDSKMYKLASAALPRVLESIDSDVTTVVGMHEKLVRSDYSSVLEFVAKFAAARIDDADAKKALLFLQKFPEYASEESESAPV